ncbi:MAG: hypothetical protein EXR71_10535 [Myxococcales bacterium]|nr:hypothetical protein [Myxococcales bacterium]
MRPSALEAYYECTLFPSSISTHVATFEADGDISFVDYPDYFGEWTVTGSALEFYYATTAGVEAEFVGDGVDSGTENCWEGLTTVPGSAYEAPYRVCRESPAVTAVAPAPAAPVARRRWPGSRRAPRP